MVDIMNKENNKPNVALYVNDFLPYTHVWIYRQIKTSIANVKLVICNNRLEKETFPFNPCVVGENENKIIHYIRQRFWFFFKYFPVRLTSKTAFLFEEELVKNKIELVHAHFGTNGVLVAPICKKLNIPLVVTFHGFDISSAPLRWPAYKKSLLRLFDQLKYAIVISEEMAQRLKEMGCPVEKIQVSYLGVPIASSDYIERTSEGRPVVFLHSGRLTAKKGVPDMVRAFSKAFINHGEAELWIAGDGEEKEMIHQVIKKEKPICRVKELGRLSDQELNEVRKQADVFVANCRTDAAGTKEGLPISILEACATGLPVISTFHAGIPEAIVQGKTGIMIPEYDNEELAKAMLSLLDKEKRKQMGKEAFLYMERKFKLEQCNHVLSELYNAAIK